VGRVAALLAVLAALVAWYEVAPHVSTRTQSFALTLKADRTAFTGAWHYAGHPTVQRAWPGTRRSGAPLNWTGTWDARPPVGNHDVLRLHQRGSAVTGTIERPDGALIDIDGQASGPHLSFAVTVGGWSLWPSILLIAFVLIPACFLLVWIALPLWSWRWDLPAAGGSLLAAIVFSYLHLPVASNFSKLAAMTLFGWWFLSFFEALSWVVIVALLIPWVDAYSVWRGPTKTITEHHENVFGSLSVAFVVPGGGAARLGLPDILFFALFLGASARFRLRPFWTFVGLTLGLSLTIVCATWWGVAGLPALPGIALGFLLPNIDLLARRLHLPPVVEQSSA
jgi:hypothetical protein